MEDLMLHQKEGLLYLYDRRAALLCDEAGLGKTRQALEAARYFLKRRKALVLCPTSVIPNWYAEAAKWDFPQDKLVVVGLEKGFITKFEELDKQQFSVCIIDEFHLFANPLTQRGKLLLKFFKGRQCRLWAMSGTPIVTGAQDLFLTLSLCKPGQVGKYGDFVKKFCERKEDKWKPGGYVYYGVRNKLELKKLYSDIMLRRFKHDYLEDLPYKLESDVPLNAPKAELQPFSTSTIIRAVLSKVNSDGKVTLEDEVQETIQQLGLRKVPYVMKFIQENVFPHPCVVFAHHRAVLDLYVTAFEDAGRRVGLIIGGMTKEDKFKVIQRFMDGELDDIVCSIRAGGIGNNFYRASRCVYGEFPWTYAALSQSYDRLHRIGQKCCVNVYKTFMPGTFEEFQLRSLEDRAKYLKDAVGIYEKED